MNKYFRAIGFSEPMTSVGLQTIVNEVLASPEYREYTTNGDDTLLAEFRMEFGPSFGVSVVGEFDGDDKFRYEYCYPYLISDRTSSTEKVTIEPRIREEAYAGVCEDAKLGVTLIFHLQNLIPYCKRYSTGGVEMAEDPIAGCQLAALSNEGTILMPIQKSAQDLASVRTISKRRNSKMRKAIDGDDEAMQDITMEDMDLYASVNKHLESQDVYTIVDNYFMPYGVESDMYSLMGEISRVRKVQNKVTDETLVQMSVVCNGLPFEVQINEKDLYGEPLPGRRFKGVVWMQGTVEYPA